LLCAKVGFTQLRRRRYGAPAARRLSFAITEKSKSSKKISKMRKNFKIKNLCIGFLKIFHKKEEVGL